jgi:hypothetical protein
MGQEQDAQGEAQQQGGVGGGLGVTHHQGSMVQIRKLALEMRLGDGK